ncbi:HAMP domain-containing sensor histidine kinase [Corynebacterium sp. HMSC034A01]|uniref:HAMP domain-containing sensor histidine kinase n=1 Tax=Corynebacterium sp. HMSC034A01 TaxID=1739295 RepID=UPI001FEEE932|nr:HAMP domain-containing sensor histidine kinase [Corynebacterium sp. HMSC034A01]
MAVLAGGIVAVVILLTALFTYRLSETTRLTVMDDDLRTRTYGVALQLKDLDGDDQEGFKRALAEFRRATPWVKVSAAPAGSNVFYGDPVPVAGPYTATSSGDMLSQRTVAGERVVVRRSDSGVTVAMSQQLDVFGIVSGSWGAAALVIAGTGGLLAWVAGAVIAAVGLRPVRRLHRAIDAANESDQLTELPVDGDDEFAEITTSVNKMISTLEDSKTRQAQLVADAGHELKTPLTSMRTNIELLMMLYNSGRQDQISEQDRKDLERDVMAQMEEMSILIGDLVDLTRDEAQQGAEPEDFRLDKVLEEALDRVRRRRPDLAFQFEADPWIITGDRFAMGRAPINLIDNAAKWSPQGGTVRVSLKAAKRNAVLIVDDSGPGIPADQREKVFERFYRAPESRSMPGSGLGLAIVKQVFDRHNATVVVEESDDGGARFRVVFPGRPPGADGTEVEVPAATTTSRVIPRKRYS